METFLKLKSGSSSHKIDSERLREEIPELWARVVILRDRLKELRRHFERDARKRIVIYLAVTIISLVICMIILAAEVRAVSIVGSVDRDGISYAFSAATAFVTLLVSAIGALGLNKQYQAMFHALWILKALEMDIDVTVHNIAISASKRERRPDRTWSLNAEELTELNKMTAAWLSRCSATLTSFGLSHGSSYGALTTAGLKLLNPK